MVTNEDRSFFADVPGARHERLEALDTYRDPEQAGPRPAVLFVHGGPVARDKPAPRDWDVFAGYGALAARAGLVGVTFNHRLYDVADYPLAAGDVADAVEKARELETVDPDRIALWYFSGGGPLAADWLRDPPAWLRCVAWPSPLLATLSGWPVPGHRFDVAAAVTASPGLPKLLVTVGREFDWLVPTQEAFLAAAADSAADVTTLSIPDAEHAFEMHGFAAEARVVTDEAMTWLASTVSADDGRTTTGPGSGM